ncbi:MAG: MATE family efflux transporter [Saccharofermentans sp.]|nr:MATE family efflux transporter [Saccharofermentans sp.]
MSSGTSTDFSKGSVAGHIVKQALPLTLSQIVQILYNIVDRIYIGHIPNEGTEALTGLGLTFPIVSIILAFTMLFGQGGAPVFSIANGSGDKLKASKTLNNSFTLLTLGGIILTLLLYIFMKPILYAFGASDATYPYSAAYLNIYLISTVVTMLATGLNFYISAQGFPLIAMVTNLSGAIINIVLDPIFIFSLNMGIRGAAIATVIAQTLSLVWVLVFLTGRKPEFKLKMAHMKLEAPIVKDICATGFTGFVMQFTNSATQIVCNRVLKTYGGDIYVGIMAIVGSVRDIMGVVINGIVSGAQPVLGFNYGAKSYDRVKKGIRTTFIFSGTYTGLAWLIVFLFPAFFIGLFTNDKELITVAIPSLHTYFMAYIFMSFQHSGQSTFMALKKNGRAVFFSLFRKVILVIPLTLLLPLIATPSVNGVFMAEPISNIIGGLSSFLTMFFTVYLRLGKTPNSND